MKTSELIKLLKKAGCRLVKHGGSHDSWYSPITGESFLVWRHKKELPTGTANQILKDAGIK